MAADTTKNSGPLNFYTDVQSELQDDGLWA